MSAKKKNVKLTRFGVSVPEDLIESFDAYIRERGYSNRSEAIRDLIRERLVARDWEREMMGKEVAGTITYVYDHHKRELVDEIIDIQHEYGEVVLVSQHVHLDHSNCLETVIVKGDPLSLKDLTYKLKALKGIKHCTLATTTTGKDIS